MQLIKFTIMDTSCIMRLMCQMNVLPLALQITKVAGNLLSRTLIGGRAERNEYLLLHAFNEKGYILPDKQYKKRPLNKVKFFHMYTFIIYLHSLNVIRMKTMQKRILIKKMAVKKLNI